MESSDSSTLKLHSKKHLCRQPYSSWCPLTAAHQYSFTDLGMQIIATTHFISAKTMGEDHCGKSLFMSNSLAPRELLVCDFLDCNLSYDTFGIFWDSFHHPCSAYSEKFDGECFVYILPRNMLLKLRIIFGLALFQCCCMTRCERLQQFLQPNSRIGCLELSMSSKFRASSYALKSCGLKL